MGSVCITWEIVTNTCNSVLNVSNVYLSLIEVYNSEYSMLHGIFIGVLPSAVYEETENARIHSRKEDARLVTGIFSSTRYLMFG